MLLDMTKDMRRKAASDPEKLNLISRDLDFVSSSYRMPADDQNVARNQRAETEAILSPFLIAAKRLRSPSICSKESQRSQRNLSLLSPGHFQQENVTACCVAGDHDFLTTSTLAILPSSGNYGLSMESAVNVDISDLSGDEEALVLTQCLRYCHSVVLRPFTSLLRMIGWKPFHFGSLKTQSLKCSLLNRIYPLIVVLLVLFYDILLIFTCRSKMVCLCEHDDQMPIKSTRGPLNAHPRPILEDQITTEIPLAILQMVKDSGNDSLELEHGKHSHEDISCEHVIPTYVVASLLHLVAYFYGFFHFRIQEHEQLYSLMEKVFIRSQTSWGVHLSLVKNSRVLLYTVVTWMLLNVSLEILYNFTYTPEHIIIQKTLGTDNLYVVVSVLILKYVGFLLVLTIHVAVLFNFCSQCEMLIMYINGLLKWLREKSLLLKEALHEILGVREYITVLNGALGKMTAVCVFNFVELTIIGICMLFLNTQYGGMEWTYRTAYPVIWMMGIALPFVQASRLTKAGQQLRQVSFQMKVFGYQNSSQLELDSFVLFVSTATLRAKLFGVPVRPASLLLIFGGSAFLVILYLIFKVVTASGYRSLF